jgi:PAS domain S-box-containing protein
MKLLAKTAEDRYQTAAGVAQDLQRCLDEWVARNDVEPFTLGQHEIPGRLLVPEKLYGRSSQIETLLGSFDRIVATGRPELTLVSGYSGIGKSSVVNELHKVLVLPRGRFASGKFDQYKRDVPYATLAQAFQGLLRPILAASEQELFEWREAFGAALGPNARLMVELVPELRLIIGDPPPVPDLTATEAQHRFQIVLRRFIGVFAQAEHPLALFLDDLQWLDGATLDLLQDLLTQPDVRYLMLIGAYRDHEVHAGHPLARQLDALRRSGPTVHEISLGPLTSGDVEQLLADSFRCEPRAAAPLAHLVYAKTAGNPFFAVQFTNNLVDEGVIAFDADQGRWQWDLKRIVEKAYTDNVVELMLAKVSRLPPATQGALRAMACLGNTSRLSTIAIVLGMPESQVESDLWEAVRLEFVAVSEGTYRFVHDRVQEAAYSLLPEDARAEAHLRIGRLLIAHTPPERRVDLIFDLVSQVNRGAHLISAHEERELVAELNLIAGRRAKVATAYDSALKYLTAGTAMLAEGDRPELLFELELQRSECEFLTGELASADERLATLWSRAKTAKQRSAAACLRVDLYTTLNQSDRAVAVCLEYLGSLGMDWSPHPTESQARQEYARIVEQVGSRSIEDLVDLPLMDDPTALATLDVFTKVFPPALFTDAKLLSLAACRAVNLSLEKGNSDGSCVAYVWLGMIAGPHFGNYKDGFRFGRLGYELVEKRGLTRFAARTYLWFAQFVVPWTKHVRECREHMRRAFEAANSSGDLTIAAYSCNNLNTNYLAAGDALVDAELETQKGLEFAARARFGFVTDIILAQRQLIRMLRGLTPRFGSLSDEAFDEERFEQHLAAEPSLALPECWYWIRKLQARFFASDYEGALSAAAKARALLWTSPSIFETAEYEFYAALAEAGLLQRSSTPDYATHLEALRAHHRHLATWAENCPDNFETREALVAAEIARIEARILDAEVLYERAIRAANENGFVHNEALANELAARFYRARGFEKIGRAYLRDARYGYLQWGAVAKVRELDESNPNLEDEAANNRMQIIAAPAEHLDLATVIKVSRAVTGEIVFEKLLDTLMRTALEHAGAQRGVLCLTRGVEQEAQAEATTCDDAVVVRLLQTTERPPMPEAMVQYVARTHETVVLDDAVASDQFGSDAYLRHHEVRSVLCLPLVNQTKLIGVLYLENRLALRVFSPLRFAVLKLLASQAAIALENTRLYRDLEKREAQIRRLVDANILGIFTWGLHGDVIDANDAFLRIVDYTRDDLVADRLRWTELTPTEWVAQDDRAVAELKAIGTVGPYEKEYFRKDGSRVPVLIGAAIFEGTNEGLAFVLDLSEQRRAQDALRRREVELAEARAELTHVSRVTTLGELTASIAHEVSQPVTAIVNNATAGIRWMVSESPNIHEAREALRRILRDGQRASDVIDRIRSLFRKTAVSKDSVNVNETIADVIALTRAEAQRKSVLVRVQLSDDLPPITADKVQLQQVLLNLLVNAIEAMSTLTRARELVVDSETSVETTGARRTPRPHVVVTIRDTGPGLDPEQRDRIFDPFFTTKSQGLGMGLSISRSIIEAHGGLLCVQASSSDGTVFRFALPIDEVATE